LLDPAIDVVLGSFTNAVANGPRAFPLALPAPFAADLHAGGEVGLFLTAVDPGIGFTLQSRSFGTASARPVLEVSAVPRPRITNITRSGGDLVLIATNGVPGESYSALGSTDLTRPLTQWNVAAASPAIPSPEFTITITNAAGVPANAARFYLLRLD
jgi:hypothetical protein